MPKFFEKFPFWLWPIFGLICIALAIPGFLADNQDQARREALAQPMPELIDLEDFDLAENVSPVGEVNVFAQTDPNYRFVVDGTGLASGIGHVVPLFSVMAAPGERSVKHVLITQDLDGFEAWLKANIAGTARMGELYSINGEVVSGKGFTAAIRVTLRDAGLQQVDPLIIIKPFLNGRDAALNGPTYTTYGNPYILSLSGAWMIWFGFVIWSRMTKLRHSVTRRIGEIGERASEPDALADEKIAVIATQDAPIPPAAKPAASKRPKAAAKKTTTAKKSAPAKKTARRKKPPMDPISTPAE